MTDITIDDALSRVAAGELLVDVREQDEWDTGHAPSAQFLPLSGIAERLDELPRDTEFLVICHSGGRSAKATAMLTAAGFTAVNVLGGMTAWREADGPVVAGA